MTWAFEMGVRTLWQEARGEPPEGQQAVAHVLWNRLRAGRWGHSFAEVCLAPLQFSGWNSHDPNRMAVARVPDNDLVLSKLRDVLTAAEQEHDPTTGATHYYAMSMKAPPVWASFMQPCSQFGHQLFFRGRK